MKTKKTIKTVFTSSEFDFDSRFTKVNGHRIHYVEHGEGDPILFIHGNPTSSYAYRNVIKPIAKKTNRRCIAIDLLGFGKSDKPQLKHNCQLHAGIIEGFIKNLGLSKIILVAEDWGGFLGSYVMTKHREWFQSAVLMETFLWPLTYKDDFDPSFTTAFKIMRSPIGGIFSKRLNMMINKLIPEHCPISEESLQFYRDCVPTFKDKKAIGDFPKILPTDGKPRESYEFAVELQEGLEKINFPVLWLQANPGVIVSEKNPIGFKRLDDLKKKIKTFIVRDFGEGYHFLSEENPERVIEMVSVWTNEISEGIHERSGKHVYAAGE